MKFVFWTVAICLSVSFLACRDSNDKLKIRRSPDRNRIDLARAVLQLEGVKFTEADLLAFDQSAEVTVVILNAVEAPPLIQILRPNQRSEDVPYEEIESQIRKGNVVQAGQNHSNTVEILTREGRRLVSKQPKIDAINALCEEVDPKGVFIKLWTE